LELLAVRPTDQGTGNAVGVVRAGGLRPASPISTAPRWVARIVARLYLSYQVEPSPLARRFKGLGVTAHDAMNRCVHRFSRRGRPR
jgi:hypothetical protein